MSCNSECNVGVALSIHARRQTATIRAGRARPQPRRALTAGPLRAGSSLAALAAASLAAVRAGDSRQQYDLARICECLRQTELFADLEGEDLRDLARICSEQTLPKHAQVFRRGDASDAVYVLRQGSVVVLRDQRGRPVQILARLSAGEIFGELGVLHGSDRGASVRTTRPCRLLRIGKRAFLRFLEDHGAITAKLEGLAARRHCHNARAALDVDTRTDVRIRIDTEVTLVPADGRCRAATLENISRGGLSLTGVPAEWGSKSAVGFTLIGAGEQLDVTARVAWRQGETVGLAFTGRAATQGHRVSLFTRKLLDELS